MKPISIRQQVENLHDIVSRGVSEIDAFDLWVRDRGHVAVRFDDAGSRLIAITVEVGAMRLPFEARFADDGDDEGANESVLDAADAILSVVADAWANRDDLAARLEDLRECEDDLLLEARAAGGTAGMIAIGLHTVSIPLRECGPVELELIYEGIDAATLRRCRKTVHGIDADAIGAKMLEGTLGRDPTRAATRAALEQAGAAGRIGSVALAYVDAEPEGRTELLRRLGWTGELQLGDRTDRDRPAPILRMEEGTAVLDAFLGDDVRWRKDRLVVDDLDASGVKPGHDIGRHVVHPRLNPAFKVAAAVEGIAVAMISLEEQMFLFDRDGGVIGLAA